MIHKRYATPGASPGTMIIDSTSPLPVIRVISYSADTFEEKVLQSPEELPAYLARNAVTWIDVQGFGDENVIRRLGEIFELHPLALSDIVNTPQRPKVEEYEKNLFIISRMIHQNSSVHIHVEQVSFFVGTNYLLSFVESGGENFEPVRERIRKGKGNIRKMGVDYLGYAIFDVLIDGFYPVLETLGEALEKLEEEVILKPDTRSIVRIHRIKRDLLTIRRAIWPQRESINELLREAGNYMTEKTQLYLRDCYDHVVQIMDVVETYRDVASSLQDVYLSSVSNRMNEVMKVLTVIGTIFLPLTFFAGVYGMNFKYFPELEWRYGYFIFWLLMIFVAVFMIFYFRKLGWLSSFSTGKKKRKSRSE